MPGLAYPLSSLVPVEQNQWTQGLRWLWWGAPATANAASSFLVNQRSRMDRALTGSTHTGLGANYRSQGGFKGYQLNFGGNGDCYLSWGSADVSVNQGRFLGDVTMIASVNTRVGGNSTNYSIGGTLDASNGFAITAVGNNTTSSWGAFARETGTTNSATVLRTDLTVGNFTRDVVGLRLRSVIGTIEIWQNGILGGTNTTTAKVWNSTDSLDFKIGGFPGDTSSERFNGDIYWIAIFDMAVPGPVIQKWSRTSDVTSLIFSEPMMPGDGTTNLFVENEVEVENEFTDDLIPVYDPINEVEVEQTLSFESPYALETDLVAEAATGGDIPSGPGGGDYTHDTQVAVDATTLTFLTPDIPLVVYNLINVENDVDIPLLDVLDNEVGLNQSISLYLGDSPNVLVGNRYRR